MDLDPRISTPREYARTFSRSETHEWEEKYHAYLRSPAWKQTRNLALRRANWKCTKCQTNRGLQVHHRTYIRLGHERPEDLDVLCGVCHEGQHIDGEAKVRGIYLAIVSDCLRASTFKDVADLMEAAKTACARQKVPYDGAKLWRAISLTDANRRGIFNAPAPRVPAPTLEDTGRPVTKAEALAFCRQLGLNVAQQFGMPQLPVQPDYETLQAQANQLRQQAAVAHQAEQAARRARILVPDLEHEAKVRTQAAEMLKAGQ